MLSLSSKNKITDNNAINEKHNKLKIYQMKNGQGGNKPCFQLTIYREETYNSNATNNLNSK